ncbi:MAG: carbohydrate binding family 9 domain-containing protein, partial [Ignavibacteriaceae bacterium]|nr:carbohydrate binding family 9 domain-containing protein [Ignavibacteriaceae bacterium]
MVVFFQKLGYKVVIILFFLASLHSAQPKIAYAVRTINPPEIDGFVTDSVWQKAIPITDFTQHEPIPGNPPSFKTTVRILYDEDNIYVSFFCYDDEPSKIIARELKLDGKWSGDDNVAIFFDTFNDDRNAYWFGTNPLGMRDDILLTGNHGMNESWHGVWDVRSAATDSGWSTEMVFPFSTFKFYDIEKQIWGINFYRKIQRFNEEVQWEGYAANQNFFNPAYGGTLLGIKGIKRGTPIYLKPFVTGGAQLNADAKNYVHKPGLDIKYGITETLSLDLTFNTDFAQVESDRARINLTRFPLFFPEKRDFFLEGSSVFSFSLGGNNNLFYSRRIGLSKGEEIPIIGGAKLVGRTKGAEIGIIDMQTSRKGIEPTTNYGVGRVKFDLLEKSYAGFFIANKYSKEGFNRVYAGDAEFVFSDFLGDKNLIIGAGVAKSDEKNGMDNSWAGKIYIDYPNDLIDQYMSYSFIQESFNPSIGFISRSGIQS